MSRAIIHNSDYQSVDDAKAAIDRYFSERNTRFRDHPPRAGGKVWGRSQRAAKVLSEGNRHATYPVHTRETVPGEPRWLLRKSGRAAVRTQQQ
jgi:hypothetical protein